MKSSIVLSLGAALVSLVSTVAMAQSSSCAPIQSIECSRQDQVGSQIVESTVTVNNGELTVKQRNSYMDPQAVASVRYMESFQINNWSDQCSLITVHASKSSTLTIKLDKDGLLKGELASKVSLHNLTCNIQRQ